MTEKMHSLRTNALTIGAVTASIAVVIAGVAYWIAPSADATVLTIDAQERSLGDVFERPDYQHSVLIRNPGRRDVRIVDVQTSCACSHLDKESFIIPARSAVPLTMSLNLLATSVTPSPIREFGVHLLLTDSEGSTKSFEISGRVRRPFSLNPPAADFRDEIILGGPLPSRELELVPHASLVGIRVSKSSQAEVRVTREDSGKHIVTVTPLSSLSTGPFRFDVHLAGVLENGDVTPPVIFPCFGRISSDVFAIPSSLHLPSLSEKEYEDETVVLQARSPAPFRVVSIWVEPSDSLVVEATHPHFGTASSEPQSFRVRRPSAQARVQSRIHFQVEQPNRERSVSVVIVPVK